MARGEDALRSRVVVAAVDARDDGSVAALAAAAGDDVVLMVVVEEVSDDHLLTFLHCHHLLAGSNAASLKAAARHRRPCDTMPVLDDVAVIVGAAVADAVVVAVGAAGKAWNSAVAVRKLRSWMTSTTWRRWRRNWKLKGVESEELDPQWMRRILHLHWGYYCPVGHQLDHRLVH